MVQPKEGLDKEQCESYIRLEKAVRLHMPTKDPYCTSNDSV
jgi:hypothetical protein